MNTFLKILFFLRLVDEDYKLSLTNISVIAVLIKISWAAEVNFTDAGALLIALLNYAYKRSTQCQDGDKKAAEILEKAETQFKAVCALESKIDEVNTKLSRMGLAEAIGGIRSGGRIYGGD